MGTLPTPHLRVLILEPHPFQLIDLERMLNRCGCFNLTPAMDARDIERLIEKGMHYDLVVCKAAHISGDAYQKERDLLELLVRSGDVSRLVLISDVLVGRQHKALLGHLSCAHVMSLAPPLSPERIQLHLAPYLFKYVKQLSSTTTPLFSSR